MSNADSKPHAGTQPQSHPNPVPNVLDDDLDVPEHEAPDELSEETGIDLTDASDLDADNVPADEETERVVQAPD